MTSEEAKPALAHLYDNSNGELILRLATDTSGLAHNLAFFDALEEQGFNPARVVHDPLDERAKVAGRLVLPEEVRLQCEPLTEQRLTSLGNLLTHFTHQPDRTLHISIDREQQ